MAKKCMKTLRKYYFVPVGLKHLQVLQYTCWQGWGSSGCAVLGTARIPTNSLGSNFILSRKLSRNIPCNADPGQQVPVLWQQ